MSIAAATPSIGKPVAAPAGMVAHSMRTNRKLQPPEGAERPVIATLGRAPQPEPASPRIGISDSDRLLSDSAALSGTSDKEGHYAPEDADHMSFIPGAPQSWPEPIASDSNDPGDGGYSGTLDDSAFDRQLPTPAKPGQDDLSQNGDGPLPKWRLKRVMVYIEANIACSISLADLASTAGLSKMYFAAQFRSTMGVRPHHYVLRRRVEHAQVMLVETNETIVAIALTVGFQTQAHFSTVFKRFTGATPRQWREANRQGTETTTSDSAGARA